ADRTAAEQPVRAALDALSNQDDPGLANMAPNQKLLRVFDLAAVALRALAKERPIALLIDDLQWADEDSLRMLRYIVRANAGERILLVLAARADEVAFVNEAVTLLADLERIGPLRRLKLRRFSQLESTEFLQQVLGRSFSLRDLHDIEVRLGENGREAESLADILAPAVGAGLLSQHPAGSAADYSFSHDQIREYLTAQLTPPRRRAIHGAIVDLL